ncbi:DUF4124 domain-containing protein [Paraneptunicella aestuarii]|uniref:DUF4124 domain-containing protein n=1 Tax=Paraneptunicella aestuarii TaxID=2831148 RepID=UPI001E5B321E|nr:DUF4124 domain-containing protein [Paraneptunicella aestuarii]UAA38445.1 DUF4124 domain-containing protein [Paraneptunicella aestuarii]
MTHIVRYLLLIFLVVSAAAYATIYKRTLEDGTVIYTDIPTPDAVPVEENQLQQNVIETSKPSIGAVKSGATKTPQAPIPTPKKIYKLTITHPQPEATIRNNAGALTVSGKITPNAGGLFQLLIDGEVMASANQPQFQLEGINRGAHKIQLRLMDNKGKLIASSPIHQVYFHRASALNQAN